VLTEEEFLLKPGSKGRLPALTVYDLKNLPDPRQSFGWDHVQFAGDHTELNSTVASQDPHRLSARLLCPRRLEPNRTYTAFLVPTFERGRLAGLRQTVGDHVHAQAPAWNADDRPGTPVELPVYYQWRFGTGAEGDFEQLVRRLEPRRLPPGFGKRAMAMHATGLPASHGTTHVESSLQRPAAVWSDEFSGTTYGNTLVELINTPAEYHHSSPHGGPIVAPPLYGQWHAATDRIGGSGAPAWFDELNRDPRLRVAAALGTQIVQARQQELMAGAWRQLEGILRINAELRYSQLARSAAMRLYTRDIAGVSLDHFFHTTAPVLHHVRFGETSVATHLEGNPVTGVMRPGWRRLARRLGRVGRRQGRLSSRELRPLLSRVASGEISAAFPPPVNDLLSTSLGLSADVAGPRSEYVRSRLPIFDELATDALPFGMLLLTMGTLPSRDDLPASRPVHWWDLYRDALENRRPPQDPKYVIDAFQSVPGRSAFRPVDLPPGGPTGSMPIPDIRRGGSDSAESAAFRDALTEMLMGMIPSERIPWVTVNLEGAREALLAALHPRTSFADAIAPRLRLGPGVGLRRPDPLEPVLATPEFDMPMFRPLEELSRDWIAAGLDQVPADTVTLLETNQRFVEAYMLGLNHEMMRELLWHGFPTDQRGTCFRQFWDPSAAISPDGTPKPAEDLHDILPIHTWRRGAVLGANSPRALAFPPGAIPPAQLCLLIRGELLRRYPTAVITAVRAMPPSGPDTELNALETLYPVFGATLSPDVTVLGFDLTREDVLDTGDDSRWYFVIQEQPTETRFGLDAPDGGSSTILKSWNDLEWRHVPLTGGRYINLAGLLDLPPGSVVPPEPPSPAWNGMASNSAYLAGITLQVPVRVAIPAVRMLPPQS
jgi:hypothetical protein